MGSEILAVLVIGVVSAGVLTALTSRFASVAIRALIGL
jgi:hypothetical protein